ncbi:large proline-rich protein BAG6 isoform X2 [Armigeres subalbatus]|uniref:large proline-rich protein BAG6 isoform X2 n=1 Tax=Armigeres subalbatus TaxID=124917 RepID=UPI002ED1D2BF
MINLKVKTLDSQNHDFSVEDDITVRQFKEQIAEKINVSVDMQRLIYCGRVLSDDKPLKEYDVNGKVVHLVQRAPPSARGSSTSGSNLGDDSNRGSANRRSRSSDNAGRPQMFRGLDDFNTMYFGSMTSIPLNVNATTPPQIPSVSPSSTLCMNRITVARHMLQCVDNIISYLEAPERGLNNTSMDILSQQTMESTVFEVGISAVGDVDIPHNQMQNFVQAFQGAVSAAFRQNGISNVTVQQQDTLNPSVQVFGTIPDSAIITPPNTSATATPAQESSGASSGSSSTSSSTSESSADSRRQARPGSSRNQTTSTQTLAEVVNQMRRVQRRMEPFLQQYFDILQNDPTFEESDTAGRESAQRVFDRISEALHYMSHAQHAISDLMLDLQTTAPRHLCCRPILIEQSAFNNINLANLLRATNNNNNTDMGNNNINAQIINVAIPTMSGSTPSGPIHIPLLEHVGHPQRPAGDSGPTSGTGSTPPTTASGPNTGSMPPPNQQQQQQQGQSTRHSVNNLPDDVVTRVYIPLYDPSTVARMQNMIQSMGAPPSRDGSATRAANPRSSNTSAGGNNAATNDSQQPQQTTSPSTGNSRTTSESDSHSSSSSPERLLDSNNAQMQVARLIQAVVNAAPIHADIHVQINAGGNSPGSSAPSTPGTGSTTTSNSSGGPQANPTMTNNTSTNTNSGSNDNGSQSRFATVTLPTTSTQTRSTSRPHVHSIPPAHIRNVRPIPANILSSFDRFLSCNSHHIRDITDRAATDSATPRNAPTVSNASSNNSSNGSTPTPAASCYRSPSPMDVDDIESTTAPELVSDIAEISISIEPPIVNLDQCTAIVISAAPVSNQTSNISQATTPVAMDNSEDVTMTIPVAFVEPQVPPPLLNDNDELPAVIIGSEPWHSHLPSTWIPVITRDITRQRRQNPQGPYSDAYISGMSSKRRKLIAETKPSSDVPSLITDGIRHAFRATGINPASSGGSNSNMGSANLAVDELARSISDDTALQSSYCETMKASIRERLSKDPDYDAKRFPNCSKYFEK